MSAMSVITVVYPDEGDLRRVVTPEKFHVFLKNAYRSYSDSNESDEFEFSVQFWNLDEDPVNMVPITYRLSFVRTDKSREWKLAKEGDRKTTKKWKDERFVDLESISDETEVWGFASLEVVSKFIISEISRPVAKKFLEPYAIPDYD